MCAAWRPPPPHALDRLLTLLPAPLPRLAAVFVTLLFCPDLTGLDLKEGDKRWLAIVAGEAGGAPPALAGSG